MSTNVKIEVDEQTADVRQARAAELGVTLSELVAELATRDSEPIVVEPDKIAEFDRQEKDRRGESTVPHERVVRWLRTWGTPRFRPWKDQYTSQGRTIRSPTSRRLVRISPESHS